MGLGALLSLWAQGQEAHPQGGESGRCQLHHCSFIQQKLGTDYVLKISVTSGKQLPLSLVSSSAKWGQPLPHSVHSHEDERK